MKVLMGHFTFFSVTQSVRMIRAKNYEKLSKFVKVTAKILSVPFFRTQCMVYNISAILNAKAYNKHTFQ